MGKSDASIIASSGKDVDDVDIKLNAFTLLQVGPAEKGAEVEAKGEWRMIYRTAGVRECLVFCEQREFISCIITHVRQPTGPNIVIVSSPENAPSANELRTVTWYNERSVDDIAPNIQTLFQHVLACPGVMDIISNMTRDE